MSTMMIAQVTPEVVKQAADYAAAQSDRWMFVALLIIGLVTLWMIAKYFTRQHESLANKLDDTNAFVRGKMAEQVEKTTEVIVKNTEVLNDIRDVMTESGSLRRDRL